MATYSPIILWTAREKYAVLCTVRFGERVMTIELINDSNYFHCTVYPAGGRLER